MTRDATKTTMRRSFLLPILVLAVAAGILGAAARYLGIKTRMDIMAYAEMIHDGFPPVCRDLALRRIVRGDSLDDLVAKHAPYRRDDCPPFVLLYYQRPFGSLTVAARDGTLVQAEAGGCTWQHVFFETPEVKAELARAHLVYVRERLVEIEMYRIHRAVASGQNVFMARAIGDFPVSTNVSVRGAAIKKLPIIEVEVPQVVCGTIERGTKLHIPTAELRRNDLAELEPVFLHVEDSCILYPHSRGGELYATVSRISLGRYRTLTDAQLREMEARCLSRWPDQAKCLRFARNDAKGQPTSAGGAATGAAPEK